MGKLSGTREGGTEGGTENGTEWEGESEWKEKGVMAQACVQSPAGNRLWYEGRKESQEL